MARGTGEPDQTPLNLGGPEADSHVEQTEGRESQMDRESEVIGVRRCDLLRVAVCDIGEYPSERADVYVLQRFSPSRPGFDGPFPVGLRDESGNRGHVLDGLADFRRPESRLDLDRSDD